jgi:hypothetical protein
MQPNGRLVIAAFASLFVTRRSLKSEFVLVAMRVLFCPRAVCTTRLAANFCHLGDTGSRNRFATHRRLNLDYV